MRAVALVVLLLAPALLRAEEPAPDWRHGSYEVTSPETPPLLRARVSFERDTGTMHEAERIVLESAAGTLELKPDYEHGPQLPLVQRILAVPSGFVLLGWSSSGGGMGTLHATLVRITATGPQVDDELRFEGGRGDGRFVLDRKHGLRIGVVVPACAFPSISSERPQKNQCWLHSREEWSIATRSAKLTLDEAMDKLAFRPFTLDARSAYCPPFDRCDGAKKIRVAWFDTADAFVPRK